MLQETGLVHIIALKDALSSYTITLSVTYKFVTLYCITVVYFIHFYNCSRFAELHLETVTRNQSGNYSCTVTIEDNVAIGYGILTVTCELPCDMLCCSFLIL